MVTAFAAFRLQRKAEEKRIVTAARSFTQDWMATNSRPLLQVTLRELSTRGYLSVEISRRYPDAEILWGLVQDSSGRSEVRGQTFLPHGRVVEWVVTNSPTVRRIH